MLSDFDWYVVLHNGHPCHLTENGNNLKHIKCNFIALNIFKQCDYQRASFKILSNTFHNVIIENSA